MTVHGKFHFLTTDQLDRMAWSEKKEYYKTLNDALRQRIDELDEVLRDKDISSKKPSNRGGHESAARKPPTD